MSKTGTLESGGVIPKTAWQPLRSVGVKIAAVVVAAFALTMPGGAVAAQVPDDSPPSTPLEKIQALVQPAVVYEQITWTASVYDNHNEQYIPVTSALTTSFQCTGFVVNPDGYVGTAGHCVSFDDAVKAALVAKVVDWTFANDYYEALPSKETIATFATDWRFDGKTTTGQPDPASVDLVTDDSFDPQLQGGIGQRQEDHVRWAIPSLRDQCCDIRRDERRANREHGWKSHRRQQFQDRRRDPAVQLCTAIRDASGTDALRGG